MSKTETTGENSGSKKTGNELTCEIYDLKCRVESEEIARPRKYS